MRLTIRNKLVVTYMLISLFTALLIYLLIYFTSEPRLNQLTREYQQKEITQEVISWWAAEHTWEGFGDYFKELHPPPKWDEDKPQSGPDRKKTHGLFTTDRVALLRYLGYMPGDTIPGAFFEKATPIKYKGEQIAWIIPPDATGISLNSELQVYLDNTRYSMMIAILISLFLSLGIAVLLARITTKPLESLTKATTAIAQGDLEQNVPELSNDEVGDLSRSFNKMSKDLARADAQKKQLTADITHDLGTPVQVISGYIEMAQEGDLELNHERLAIISDELKHVQNLLKDMSLLAQTDANTLSLNLAETDIRALLERVFRSYKNPCENEKILLTLDCPRDLPHIKIDEEQVIRVLGNLVSNAIRYTPENGDIEIKARSINNQLKIEIHDSGCGIQPEDLPLVFERFYRSDTARTGACGKMGLGLSISKGLVEVHGGNILVESDGKSGSTFIISLPIQQAS